MDKAKEIYQKIYKELTENDLSIGEISSIIQAITSQINSLKISAKPAEEVENS